MYTLQAPVRRARDILKAARVRDQSTHGFLSSNFTHLFIRCQPPKIKAAYRAENRKDFFQFSCIHWVASFSLTCFSNSYSCKVNTDMLFGADLPSRYVFFKRGAGRPAELLNHLPAWDAEAESTYLFTCFYSVPPPPQPTSPLRSVDLFHVSMPLCLILIHNCFHLVLFAFDCNLYFLLF